MIFQPAKSKTALGHVLAQAALVEVVGDGPAGGRIIDIISIIIRYIIYSIGWWEDNRYYINICEIYYIFNFDILFEAARVEVVSNGAAGGSIMEILLGIIILNTR